MADSVSVDSRISNLGPNEVRFSEILENESNKVKTSQRIPRMASRVFLPRLITRDYPYHQSSNRVQVFNKHKRVIFRLFIKDWFHVILRVPTYISGPLIIFFWYLMIWAFAWIYRLVDSSNFNLDKDCGLGEPGIPLSMPAAYAFSLETCTTVGCEYSDGSC